MNNPTHATMVEAIDEPSEDTARRMNVTAFASLSDAELCKAYQATDRGAGDPIADLLAVAAHERGLDL